MKVYFTILLSGCLLGITTQSMATEQTERAELFKRAMQACQHAVHPGGRLDDCIAKLKELPAYRRETVHGDVCSKFIATGPRRFMNERARCLNMLHAIKVMAAEEASQQST